MLKGRHRMKHSVVWLSVLSTVVACLGESRTKGTPGGSSGRGGDGAAGSVGGGAVPSNDPSNFGCLLDRSCTPSGNRADPLPPPSCPALEPGEDEPCASPGLQCSYGDSVTAYCRRYYTCDQDSWTVPPSRSGTCVTQPSGFCPREPQHGEGCTVGEVDVFVACEYSGGIGCYCLGNPVGRVGAEGSWECYAPPTNPACPESLPNLGDGCAASGQVCHYGIVQQGCYAPYADVYCFQGAWEASSAACTL